MFKLEKDNFADNDFFKKECYEQLNSEGKVVMYMRNWDKSHGDKQCFYVGQVRTRFIQKFLKDKLSIIKLPKLEEQYDIVIDNFDLFKSFIKECFENQ